MVENNDNKNEKVFSFTSGSIESYTLTVNPEVIRMDCYTPGSPTGGTGTECAHSIPANSSEFFAEKASKRSVEKLVSKVPSFDLTDWRELHRLISVISTDNFVWYETNWND